MFKRQSKYRLRSTLQTRTHRDSTDVPVLLRETRELQCEREVALFDGVAYFFICHVAMEFGKQAILILQWRRLLLIHGSNVPFLNSLLVGILGSLKRIEDATSAILRGLVNISSGSVRRCLEDRVRLFSLA